jgi:hypothetical protein
VLQCVDLSARFVRVYQRRGMGAKEVLAVTVEAKKDNLSCAKVARHADGEHAAIDSRVLSD